MKPKIYLSNPLYSWGSIIGFSIIIGIMIWSYMKHIAIITYSTLVLLITCITMIRLYAYNKSSIFIELTGGYNGITLFVTLYFFVFVTIFTTVVYLYLNKFMQL
jgi:hypothetical protein